jgi:hypothetical protein
MILSITTNRIMSLSVATFSIIMVSIKTFNILGLIATKLSINIIQNKIILSAVFYCYAGCHAA